MSRKRIERTKAILPYVYGWEVVMRFGAKLSGSSRGTYGGRGIGSWVDRRKDRRERGIEDQTMAKGMKCRICGGYMYAQREDDQPKGRWVYYVCRASACTNTEKVFEKYP